MDNKISESVQKVVSTMAISGMNLSEEFINQLIEVELSILLLSKIEFNQVTETTPRRRALEPRA